jgi:four helix bundle protein
MNKHRNLKVWQCARELVGLAYKLTDGLPEREKFIAVPQFLRAAWSVQNNIAEGYAKLGRRERRRFFDTAIGSLAEVDSMACTLNDVYKIEENLLARIEKLRRAINGGLFAMLRGRD